MSLQNHINIFCKFFNKYNSDYENNMTGSVIGSFKSNYKDSFNQLAINNVEFNSSNFCEFSYKLFSKANLDSEDVTSAIHSFLMDAIIKKPNYGKKSQFTEDNLIFFQKFH